MIEPVGRPLEIIRGIGVSRRLRKAYLRRWHAQGTFILPPDVLAELEGKKPEPVAVRERRPRPDRSKPCVHRGEPTGETYCKPCQSRTGKASMVATFACALHGDCVLAAVGKPIRACSTCGDFSAEQDAPSRTCRSDRSGSVQESRQE